ncbi:putative oxidoreductase [Listeria floridensis FSL S10-1187]|uniref:Oxidoreductase n=1 Tax=Listeria floridensis FSL S10-1187 TaxID=1265817 RepID=A0ABN0RFL3_9LIST|nr:SDR family oxidoreductase [Listeria floridensis]EUJ32110.1 putative oxidoreductase [Listeria floridensis FSL S10-1187]
MNRYLAGKTVLITGASSGLGESLAHACAEEKAHLVLIARNLEKLEELAGRIEASYEVNVSVYKADLTEFANLDALSKKILDAHDVDVLINNAGFGLFETALDTPFETVKAMFETNVLGLIKLTQLFLPTMLAKHSGHVINIASQAAKIATPKSSAYAGTKFAVLGYSNALRMELSGTGVHVTTINPGPMKTQFFDIADRSGEYLENVGFFALKPEKVATKTVRIIGKPRREVNLPLLMNIGTRVYQVIPSVIEFFGKSAFMKK